MSKSFNPEEALAAARHEFGEHGGVNLSIENSTTFTVMEPSLMADIFAGKRGPETDGLYVYGRHYNPTIRVLGRQLAALEGTEAAYCTASGLSAVSAVVQQLCSKDDHVVSSSTIYGGTFALFHEFLPRTMGLKVSFVDTYDLAAVEKAMTKNTKILYAETLSNPTLRVAQLPKLAEIAHKFGAKLVVDNTFAPMIVSPAQHGADIVLHSLTKYINGASDIIGGAICCSRDFINQLVAPTTGALMLTGPTMDPPAAYSVSMRLPHLPIRMRAHAERAQALAERLEEAKVTVIYPGLKSHPDYSLLKELSNPGYGAGGILTLDLGSTEKAYALMNCLQNEQRFGFMAVSLGYFDTLMSCSAASTSSELSEEDKKRAGIGPGYLRVALGYTGSIEQRWNELHTGLKVIGAL